MIAGDIINAAYRMIGVASRGRTLSAEETVDALEALNDLIAEWAIMPLMLYARTLESTTLTAGQASYTFGTGGDIATARPMRIRGMFTRDTNIDTPVREVTREEYLGINDKTVQGLPSIYYYDTTIPTGTVYLFPVPDQNYTLWIDSEKEGATFPDTTTSVDYPNSYKSFFIYHLAIRMATQFGRQIPPEVALIADTLMRRHMATNFRVPPARFDGGMSRGGGSTPASLIVSGDY